MITNEKLLQNQSFIVSDNEQSHKEFIDRIHDKFNIDIANEENIELAGGESNNLTNEGLIK